MEQTVNADKPLISIVMPAYNVEKFIGRAIESVLNQTYSNIELVIGNDASTDRTCEIVKSYSDQRIILCHEKINTGAAYLPRKLAFDHCKGELVVPLDADDFLEEHYIEQMYNRLRECDADVCCGKMVLVDEQGNMLGEGRSIPRCGFDYSVQMTGKEAFFHTVPKWIIGMNGCMAKREVWEYGFNRTYKPGKRGIHDDENVSRYLLLYAKKVVFYESDYYYTMNSNSVTHAFNKRIFDWMIAEADLMSLICEDYGKNSKEHKAVEGNDYYAYRSAFSFWVSSTDSLSDRKLAEYLRKFQKWHDRINWTVVKKYTGKMRYFIDRYYSIEMFIYMLYKKKIKTIGRIGGRAVKHVAAKGRNNKYYKWYIGRGRREKLFRKMISQKYKKESQPDKSFSKCVVNVMDGTVYGGGLADRLRGIISTYAICKRNNLNYKLYFVYPFRLENYLEPAEYNWHIEENDICRNTKDCDFIILDTTEDSPYQFRKQEKYLEDHLKGLKRQTQVFTNAGFAYDLDYSKLFNEFFRPSPRLQKSIDAQKEILGNDYISISARFLDLLGDFNETFGHGKALPEQEAEELISDAVEQIRMLHEKYPTQKILVNSDSTRFLEASAGLDYTYSIPGNITHIDNKQDDNNYERYEKTFLDFLMIANAGKIFLIKGNGMHKSGYPYAASLIYNKDFYLIEF